jgi:hypothetical protein
MSVAAASTARLAAFTVDNHLWTVTATGKNSFSVSMDADVAPTPLAESTITTTDVKAEDAAAPAAVSETQQLLRGAARQLDGGRVLCDCGLAKTQAERVECGCDGDE